MTADEVIAFRQSLQATLDGHVQPTAYGVGLIGPTGVRFPVVNNGGIHALPAVVLAAVLGYRSGTCTIAMTPDQVRHAVELLAPVEACTEFTHPILWAWRQLLRDQPSGPFVAVFVERRDAPPSDSVQRFFLSLADNTA